MVIMQPEETEGRKIVPFIQVVFYQFISRVHINIRENITIFHDHKDSKTRWSYSSHVIMPPHSPYRKQGGRNFFHFNILLLKFL